MNDFDIEKEMYNQAVELIEQRYPIGWGGAGVVYTEQGHYFTSVSIESANASVVLCIETGAILEAHKYNERVTHCLCLTRENERAPFKILTPCGICQERLRFWGDSVRVAITTDDNSLKFVSLKELQPYHWTNAYSAEQMEHYKSTIEMRLADAPFDKIKNGKKTVEIRLYDEKRKTVKVGDDIVFYKVDNREEFIIATVIGLHRFNSFIELFQSGLYDKTGCDGMSPQDAADSMYDYYTKEQERQHRVLGIEVKVK